MLSRVLRPRILESLNSLSVARLRQLPVRFQVLAPSADCCNCRMKTLRGLDFWLSHSLESGWQCGIRISAVQASFSLRAVPSYRRAEWTTSSSQDDLQIFQAS